MAAAAAANTNTPEHYSQPPLRLVDQITLDAMFLAMNLAETETDWFSADDIPTLRAVRAQTDIGSQQMLADKRELLSQGEFDAVPYAFDVLATAKRLKQIEKTFGKESQQYRELYRGFRLDCKRHRDEARRRLSWEYFPEVEQLFDDEADSFMYGGYLTREVVDNGLSPIGSEEVGVDALIANRREEYTSIAIAKLGKLMLRHAGVRVVEPKITMLTVSQVKTSPQIMIWGLRFDPMHNRRFQEQVAFPKEVVIHEDIVEAYKQERLLAADAHPTEVDLLNLQAMNTFGKGPLYLMEKIDTVASKRTGRNIFMGRVVADDFEKDYEAIPGEAAERQAQDPEQIEALENEILRLVDEDIDGWLANRLIDEFVTDMLLEKVKDNPEAAADIFGAETAHNLARVNWLRQQGNMQAADALFEKTVANAPLATVCTGGSCDLERMFLSSEEGKKAKELTKAETGDNLVKDKVRSCKACGKRGSVVYAFNSKKVNKGCLACGATEFKQTSAPKAA